MKVFIIVLTYKNYDDTRECLDSVTRLDYDPFEVVVVDNCSLDGSLEKLKHDYPDHVYIENARNLGFSGGNNVGIRYALERGADFVWLLNNDTSVHPEALARLMDAADIMEDAGILGSMIYYYDFPDRIHFAGGKIVKGRGKGRHIGGEEVADYYFDSPLETGFATGASLLASREMIEQVGMLDEAYFLYLEDVDWALRARDKGWRTYLVPDSVVWHKVNLTTAQLRPRIIYYVCRNSLYLCRRHFPVHLPRVMAWCVYSYMVSYLVRWVLEGFSPEPLEYLRKGWEGFRDFLGGHMGEYDVEE